MDKMSVDDVYRMAHNHEYGIRSILNDKKSMMLWFPSFAMPARSRWGNHQWTDEQRSVEGCLDEVVSWMKSHPIETERFLIERSPRLAADLATKSGRRLPVRFSPENEKRFFERCAEKARFNLACVKYCDHYKIFAPNMAMLMLAAGYGTDRRFSSYIKKMQALKKEAAELIEGFLKFKGVEETVSVKELVEELRT